MLSRLLNFFRRKPATVAWQADDPQQRLQAINQLEPRAGSEQALVALARKDPDVSVRRAAIGKIKDAAALQSFTNDDDIAPAAWDQLARLALAADGTAEQSINQDLALAVLRVAEEAPPGSAQNDLAGRSLAALNDAHVAEAAIAAGSPAWRRAAAEQVSDPTLLARLERQSRNRDKTVHRLAKARLDRAKAVTARFKQVNQEADDLHTRTQKLNSAAVDALFEPQLEHCTEKLAALRVASEEVARDAADVGIHSWTAPAALAAIDTDLNQARTRLDDARRVAAEAAAAEAEAAAVPEIHPDQELADLLEAAAGSEDASGPDDATDGQPTPASEAETAATETRTATLIALRTELAARATALANNPALAWPDEASTRAQLEAETEIEPATALRQLLDAVAHARTAGSELEGRGRQRAPKVLWQQHRQAADELNRARRHLNAIHWPDDIVEPAVLGQLRVRAEQLAPQVATAEQAIASGTARLSEIVATLKSALAEGSTKQVGQLLGEGRRLQRELPNRTIRDVAAEFGQLALEAQEMRDWQAFATGPKRAELCEAMATLAAGETTDPEQRAERIRVLRSQWQELGPPGSAQDRELADRFNAAADTAFAPCREYFQEQGRIRAANLETRKRILTDLQSYLEATDWQAGASVDWAAAQQILRVARKEFTAAQPIDRARARKVVQQFDIAANALHGHVGAEMARNVAAKEAMIAEVAALADDADQTPAVKADRAKAVQQRWRSVGLVSRGDDQRLWRAFRTECDRVFAAREDAKTAERSASAALETALDQLLAELDQAVPTADAPAATEPGDTRSVAAITADIEQLDLPGRLRARANARIEQVETGLRERRRAARLAAETNGLVARLDAPVSAQVEAQVSAQAGAGQEAQKEAASRRDLTILAELRAGIESPPADHARRLELKVQQLSAGLGSQRPTDQSWDEMVDAWAAAYGSDSERAALRVRMQAAIEARQ